MDPKYDHYDFPTTSLCTLSGHPGHTTPEQDAKVVQLRKKLEQDGYTERLDTLTLVSKRSNNTLVSSRMQGLTSLSSCASCEPASLI
ncbi:Bgt-4504 [Blumeria graminis f. sp. tritici]|uniref:Bgt-4504 n=2 Tax=Blumeria graminis f. sp. tritici TaxID=62690 RepID=A0A381LEX1_BLUGR|nr:Phosphatidylinositol/phosphatidylcholine transfer protein [Blumeria graminis f. sp. tritici 96224]VDB88949.1 Bgt-4504 [Blumeria graminis f. sp. tritici]